jgi:site-specific recombinase XerD
MNTPIHISKFKQEMERQFFSPKTVENYCSCAKSYLYHFNKLEHPLHITDEQFSEYLYSNFKDQNTQRVNHSAVKKFYKICFNKDRFHYLPYAKQKNVRPIILSEQECENLLRATKNLKHFIITLTLYSTGVRINELLNIKLSDIDRANMVIHIMIGKGGKQRQVTMKPKLLGIIETYYRKYKPRKYLFENDSSHNQYSERSVNLFLKANAKKAGITKKVHAHLLRHCWATHSLEHGENLYTIQHIAGHSDPKITANNYIHGSSKIVANAYSPIDSLPFNQKQLLESAKFKKL